MGSLRRLAARFRELYWRSPRPFIRRLAMASAFLRLARRLLLLWVRLRLFCETAAGQGIDPVRPVCYALQEDWLSDRLALYEAVERLGLPRGLIECAGARWQMPAAEAPGRLHLHWLADILRPPMDVILSR